MNKIIIYNVRPNIRNVRHCRACQFLADDAERSVNEISNLLLTYAGSDEHLSKIYTNGYDRVAIMATDPHTGKIELTRVGDEDWVVIHRYTNGAYDIFVLSDLMMSRLYRHSAK